MSLFGQIKSSVNSILPSLYTDEDLTVDVTWKKFIKSEFDEDLGVNVDTHTNYDNIKAIRIDKEIASSRFGRSDNVVGVFGIATGDIVYLFRFDDLPDGVSIRDSLEESSTGLMYSVKKIIPIFGILYRVEVTGYA